MRVIGAIIKFIGNFLFSRANREFLIFVSFLGLSGVFWLVITLNETYEREISVLVRIDHVPRNAVMTSSETDTLHVMVSDKGFNILTWLYGTVHRPISIDFSQYAQVSGMGVVGMNDLRRKVLDELPASFHVGSVKPDRLVFYYNYGERKRVPVSWRGNVVPERLHYIASTTCTPDSVTIYASRARLDSITTVYTQDLRYTEFHDTLQVDAMLAPMAGVKMVPDRVSLTFITDVLTECRIDGIPVVGINLPPGKVLRTFPAKVAVQFVAGMKNYQSLSARDFMVVADYQQFKDNPAAKCRLSLWKVPAGVSRPRLEVSQVDYLIEEQYQP